MEDATEEGWLIVPGSVAHVRCLERYRFFATDVRDKVVLDCACGPGIGSAVLIEAGARRVVAVDLSERALGEVPKNCPSDKVVTVRADVTRLPFEDASFDVVVSSETVEHVADRQGYFTEIVRVLKPDGVFVMSTTNRPVFSAFRLHSAVPSHVREMSMRALRLRLEKLFDEVTIFGQDFTRRADVFYWGRRFFNAWAPVFLRKRIVSLKDRFRARLGKDEADTAEIDTGVCRVMPLDVRPGWAPHYTVARCRRPIGPARPTHGRRRPIDAR